MTQNATIESPSPLAQAVAMSVDSGEVTSIMRMFELLQHWRPAEFDPAFYVKRYPDLGALRGERALRNHFVRNGLREGRFPSLRTARIALEKTGRVLPADFDADHYGRLNPDLKAVFDEPWQFELHYLEHGRREGRTYRLSPTDKADLAIELREKGDYEESAKLTSWLCENHPNLPVGWREAAALRKLHGEDEDALPLLEKALELDPSVLSLTQLARHAAGMGLAARARAHIRSFTAKGAAAVEMVQVLDQLMQFMMDLPVEAAQKLLRDVTETPRFVGEEADVEKCIGSALAIGRPFSLIRLGDGEGAWLTDLEEQGGRYAQLFVRNRRKILETWFRSDALLERADFQALVPRLKDAIRGATIVGIPYPQRVRWEYKIASLDGVPSCMTVVRQARELFFDDPAKLFTSHDIHFGLQLSGALNRLLGSRCRTGLICCYPGLAMKLHETFGVEIVANFCIPEEKGMTDVIGPNGFVLSHFPGVFERIVERLRESDWTATLWLVGAGYLGKIYCEEIRRCGGVAVDIGSLADGWMGKKTRPTLANEIWSYQL